MGSGIMLISTKGRYALRLMTCVARKADDGVMPLRAIADEEEISLKYLEHLARALLKADLLVSTRGKTGGYRLARSADRIRVGEILKAAEGTNVSVNCMALTGEEKCPRESQCPTVHFWAGLNEAISAYVNGFTLADLVEGKKTTTVSE